MNLTYPVRKFLKQTAAPFAFLRNNVVRVGNLGEATLGPVTFKVPTLGFTNRAHVRVADEKVIPVVIWVTESAAEAMGATPDPVLEAFLQDRIAPPKQGKAVQTVDQLELDV